MFNRKLKGFSFPHIHMCWCLLPPTTIIYPVVKILSGNSFRSMGKFRSSAESVWYNSKLFLPLQRGFFWSLDFEDANSSELCANDGDSPFLIVILPVKWIRVYSRNRSAQHNTTSSDRCWQFTLIKNYLWILILMIAAIINKN